MIQNFKPINFNIRNIHHLHIELTLEQYRLLTDSARRCGLTKRAFLVRLLEGTEVKERSSQEIKALCTEIHHIGNNINQIASAGARFKAPCQNRYSSETLRKNDRIHDFPGSPLPQSPDKSSFS